MENVIIKPYLLKAVNEIAKKGQVSENDVINDLLLRGIVELEDEFFEDGLDIEIVAAEFGQTKEELIKELEEARRSIDAGEGIKVSMDELRQEYGL